MPSECMAIAEVAAGAVAVISGTAIPEPIDPIVAAATMARVMNEGLVRIESSCGEGRGQKPAVGNSTAQRLLCRSRVLSARAGLSYTLTVRNL